jgi:hypothetical protein
MKYITIFVCIIAVTYGLPTRGLFESVVNTVGGMVNGVTNTIDNVVFTGTFVWDNAISPALQGSLFFLVSIFSSLLTRISFFL